jgi:hypothetical protein
MGERIPEFKCCVEAFNVDLRTGTVMLFLTHTHSCDMGGVIRYFDPIVPNLICIDVFSGVLPLCRYLKAGGSWECFDTNRVP